MMRTSKEARKAADDIYLCALQINRKASGRHKSYAWVGHSVFYHGKAAEIIQKLINTDRRKPKKSENDNRQNLQSQWN
jgi:hypothetical protein